MKCHHMWVQDSVKLVTETDTHQVVDYVHTCPKCGYVKTTRRENMVSRPCDDQLKFLRRAVLSLYRLGYAPSTGKNRIDPEDLSITKL